jgi:dienelactone hydrolase
MDRNALLKVLGSFPARCPIEPEVLAEEDCGRFVRQSVGYSVEQGERIRAFVLIPKGLTDRAPAVFCHHQHAGQFHLGKSEVVGLSGDPDQAFGAELAERGYVVIAPDALGFEDRNWSFPTGEAEYFELASRLVRGRTMLAKVLHDVSVAIDFLETMPEVDRTRIGFLGHSYGGRMAIWAPAIDQRFRASVSNCGCVNYKNSLVREAGIQMEFCVPGILGLGDVEDVVGLVAPRALRIQAASEDKWSRGAEEIVGYARARFPDGALELGIWPGGHVFSKEMRQAAYRFLDRHLAAKQALQ